MTSATKAVSRRGQGGYSLLMVVFMVATALILSAAVSPNLLIQGRRERETEMVWRGEQYQRAIGLYFRKFGRYPTKIEDLTSLTNGVRFLRQAYPDPMNKVDGSWRLIYVGPNGQLIGSLRRTSLLQSVMSAPSLPGASAFGRGAQPAAPGAPQTGQSTTGLSANPLEAQPRPFEGQVFGGNIIGVGSKVKQRSLRVYHGGDTYEQWEFIWNPTQQIAVPGQNSANPAPPPAQLQVPGMPAPSGNQPTPGFPGPTQ